MPKKSTALVVGQKTLTTYWQRQRVSVRDTDSGPSVPVVADHDGPQPPPIDKRVVLQIVEVCAGPAPGEEGGDFGDDPSTSVDA